MLLVPAVIIFVVGEMLWVPAMQTLVVRSAPDDLRGAYLGAIGASFPVAFALGPLIGLSIRDAYGDAAMWVTMAALSIVAALAYLVAAREASSGTSRVSGRPQTPRSPSPFPPRPC